MNPKNPKNPKNTNQLAHIAALLPAALATLATARSPYALAASGDGLAPRVVNGQIVTIMPAVDASPLAVAPDTLVLAVIASNPAQPRFYDRPALFVMNDKHELTTAQGAGEVVPPGAYVLLGMAQEGSHVTPMR